MTTSRASREELEAAHERVRRERTTAEGRAHAREVITTGQTIDLSSQWVVDLLDDFLAMEAELAALRRVEAEDLETHRNARAWLRDDETCVWVRKWEKDEDGKPTFFTSGNGNTLAEALADYDARKEQSA